MKVSPDDLFGIIGAQQVEIIALRKRVLELEGPQLSEQAEGAEAS